MADLYGVGCARCNREVAAAFAELPKMDGYLDTDEFWHRYRHLPQEQQPKAYLDGKPMPHTIATVPGEDGWLICCHPNAAGLAYVCPCAMENLCVAVWRGRVELR